jgi:hypothetical protein
MGARPYEEEPGGGAAPFAFQGCRFSLGSTNPSTKNDLTQPGTNRTFSFCADTALAGFALCIVPRYNVEARE